MNHSTLPCSDTLNYLIYLTLYIPSEVKIIIRNTSWFVTKVDTKSDVLMQTKLFRRLKPHDFLRGDCLRYPGNVPYPRGLLNIPVTSFTYKIMYKSFAINDLLNVVCFYIKIIHQFKIDFR